MTQVSSTHRAPLLRRPLFWLIVVAAVLAVAVVAGLWIGSSRERTSQSAPTDAPTKTSEPTDAATAAPETPAPSAETLPAIAIPASCDDIYTRDLTPEFAGLVLNPEWTLDPASGVQFGSRDESAVDLLTATAGLRCKWGHPNGGSDRGLTTNLARTTLEQASAMQEHFVASGYDCYGELGGTRCVIETEPTPDGQSGESHFFRGDVWVATLWINAGTDGYTHDIVAAIFG